jgi:hypothetical protein
MSGAYVQDRHCYAMGVAARHVGFWAEAFRPAGPDEPLRPGHRFLRLPVSFVPARGGERRTILPGDPLWQGIFDASYTQPGDYIVAGTGIFFIASQVPLLPVLCVRTNRTISITRPATQNQLTGTNYGGYRPGASTPVLTKWPVSAITSGQYGQPETTLPTNQPSANLSLLIPPLKETLLSNGDIIVDDLGRSGVLISTEQTDLGWRATVKIVTT